MRGRARTASPRRPRQTSEPTRPGRSRVSGTTLALILAILMFVWRLQDVYPVLGRLQLPTLAIAVAFLTLLFGGAANSTKVVLREPIARWALLIAVLMLLSVPFGLYPGRSVSFLLRDHLSTLLLFFLLVYAARSFVDVERYALAQVLGAGIYSFFVTTRLTVGPSGRLGNLLYYDANDISLLLAASLPLCLYFGRPGAKNGHRLLAIGVGVLALLSVVKAGSRGGFLALLAVGVFMLFAYRAVPARTRLLAVAALVVGMLLTASETYWDLMQSLLQPTQDYNWTSDAGRKEVWKRGLGYMVRSPTGVGVANFPVAEGTLPDRAALQAYGLGWKWSSAHSSFVQIGAELGVLGLAAFLGLLGSAFRAALGTRDASGGSGARQALGYALVGSLIAYCVAGFFLAHAYTAFLYSLLGTVAALRVTQGRAADPHRPASASNRTRARAGAERTLTGVRFSIPRR